MYNCNLISIFSVFLHRPTHQNASSLSSGNLTALGFGNIMCEQSYNSKSLSMCKCRTLQRMSVAKKIEPIRADAAVYRRFLPNDILMVECE